VDFDFSEEQQELRRMLRSFFTQKSPELEVRRLMATDAGFDPAIWAQMADQLGLQGLIIPEEYGGSGFSNVELTVVLEEMGRCLLCAPFLSTVVLATNTLIHSGDEVAKKQYLRGIANGDTIATLALAEDEGSWDCSAVATRATPAGEHWSLDGVKSYVTDGHIADLILVAACTDVGLSVFAVQGDAAGLRRTLLPTLDQTRKLTRLELRKTPGVLVGSEGSARSTLETVLDLAVVGLAAEQVGGAQQALDMSVEYLKNRVQFGRPIGSFQALKHRCADLLRDIESAKSAAYYAGWCASQLNDELPRMAALAKVFCSETYFRTAAETIQLHGGIGFTWEHPAHLYFKRARASQMLFGSPSEWRETFADRSAL
jgi:alkylation response protein AidB-like acyl-CoA dehydrogenase